MQSHPGVTNTLWYFTPSCFNSPLLLYGSTPGLYSFSLSAHLHTKHVHIRCFPHTYKCKPTMAACFKHKNTCKIHALKFRVFPVAIKWKKPSVFCHQRGHTGCRRTTKSCPFPFGGHVIQSAVQTELVICSNSLSICSIFSKSRKRNHKKLYRSYIWCGINDLILTNDEICIPCLPTIFLLLSLLCWSFNLPIMKYQVCPYNICFRNSVVLFVIVFL